MKLKTKAYRLIRSISPTIKKIVPKKFYKKLKKSFKKNIIFDGTKRIPFDKTYSFGVNYFGHLKSQIGLGEGSRLYAKALHQTDIPHTLIDVPLSKEVKQTNDCYGYRLDKEPIYSINIFHINPENFYALEMMFDQTIFDHRHNIGVFLWELDRIPQSWLEYLSLFDEFIVPSTFIKEALEKVTNKPITVINYGLDQIAINEVEPISPSDKFTFLLMYDSKSNIKRKNAEGTIEAFLKAFRNNDSVRLLIKTNNYSHSDDKIIKPLISGVSNIEIFDKILSRNDTYALISQSDCIVSLHRAEGFGLVPAEAMSIGTPVIVTDYSSTTDFCNHNTAYLVKYKMVQSNITYQEESGFKWADPDIDNAAEQMILCYNDKKLRENKIVNAKNYINKCMNVKECSNKLSKIIKSIV